MIFIGLEFVGGLRESADLEQINNDRHLQIRRLDFSPTGCLWHGSSRNIGMNKRNNAMADMYLNTIRKYYMGNVSPKSPSR